MKGWIILEAGTGLMDGVYKERQHAEAAMKFMHRTSPALDHLLLEVRAVIRANDDGGSWIPDKSFWARNQKILNKIGQ